MRRMERPILRGRVGEVGAHERTDAVRDVYTVSTRMTAALGASREQQWRIAELEHRFGICIETREIWLDTYESETGDNEMDRMQFLKNMRTLERISSEPILIHECIPGGDWDLGIGIHDVIRLSPCPVTILVNGTCASMGTVILQAARRRFLQPHCTFLIHFGHASVNDTSSAVVSFAEWEREHIIPTMLQSYADRMRTSAHGRFYRKTEKAVMAFLRSQLEQRGDVYWTAEQAVELGLADAVYHGNLSDLFDD